MEDEISVTKWGSWHYLCHNLSHALEDVILCGWVRDPKIHSDYLAVIRWCITFTQDEVLETELPGLPDFDEDRLCQLTTVPNDDISCLEQDIFTSIFALHELDAVYSLTHDDRQMIEPVMLHLQSLVPWFRWTE